MMFAGAAAAIAPFVIMVLAQGTWRRALSIVGPNAARMLTLETAWPSQWENVLPLWTPMAWSALALLLWIEFRWKRPASDASPQPGGSMSPADLSFLLIWLITECIMLVFLPLRAYHYYVLSCLPLVILSGAFWSHLLALRNVLPRRELAACVSAAAVFSITLGRTIVDEMVPKTIGNFRSYDAAADREYFDEAVSWGNIDFGAPPGADQTLPD